VNAHTVARDIDRIRRGVDQANIPTLLLVLLHLTSDEIWTEDRYRPTRSRGLDDNDSGGLPRDVQQEIRDAAFDTIMSAGLRTASLPTRTADELAEMLAFASGEDIPNEYGPMIEAGLGLAATPASDEQAAISDTSAIVIGGGVSGICAAVQLQRAGIPFTVVERNPSLGGTWFENRYPGAGVDTPSHLYEFGFAPHDWDYYFSPQRDVRAYLDEVADEFDIRSRCLLSTTVVTATFLENERCWSVEVVDAAGQSRTLRATVLISAVGAFNQPKAPNIRGLGSFAGPVVHTARWSGVELAGKRVAVIGNGASAMQVVPAIVDQVAELRVFQRSPHWIAPFDKLHQRVPEDVRFLIETVPAYRGWYRIRLGWLFNDRVYPALQRDPSWPHPERAVSASNDRQREFLTAYLRQELEGRPDLIDPLLPRYPPYGKRILLDNGWFRALTRQHVRLVTDPIQEVRPEGVITANDAFECDVVILATGFDVVRFLSTVDVRGRDGARLGDVWEDDDARAYLGLAVPGFPNFFILYGPNTQPGHGGSLIPAVEAQMDCVVSVLHNARRMGRPMIEVRSQVHDCYAAEVDEAHERMVWTHPGMDTYYRNARGRVVVNSPFRIVDFWHRTRDVDDAFVVEGDRG
jgi:4-hydroxyacetophenone monooxygenase